MNQAHVQFDIAEPVHSNAATQIVHHQQQFVMVPTTAVTEGKV